MFLGGTPLASLSCQAEVTESDGSTMVGFTKEQRRMLMDKLPDAANLALGALVFGQFLQGRPFSRLLAAAGVAVWFGLLAWAMLLGRENTRD